MSFLNLLMLTGSVLMAPNAAPPFSGETLATAERLRDAALQGTGAYDIVESLCVEVGPRLAGTPADRRAVAWAVAKLKELGFEKVWTEPVTFPYWVRGKAEARVTAPFPQPLHITALGYSTGTADEGIEAEIVAVDSYEAMLETDPAAVKGKIVFIKKRMERTRDGRGYGHAVVGRGKGAIDGAAMGAVAVLIRSIGTDSHRFPHTGVMRREEGTASIPAAALSNPDANLLEGMLARGEPVRVYLNMTPRFLGQGQSANVIADVPGSERPDEIVVIGGHLDSWDLGTGAIDDGAGVAITVETARRIMALPKRPARTIRVILWANEESGLWGAKAYAAAHADSLAKHVIAAESDFGADRIWRFMSAVDEAAFPVIDAMAPLLEPLGIVRGGNDAWGGPDIRPLMEAGVPVVTLLQDGTDYFDYHHTADDTLDKIDPKALDQNVAAWTVFTYLAAMAPGDFGRLPVASPVFEKEE